ncbi:SHD1 domain-containing protein [Rhodopirellula sp. JC639]|uniref:SHD1 domain-containing protein n=1 Tax=Stieleria mannarensis TaxID=2755585 RepID=UPI0016040640|nr:SHD1 domain-containing protein [Rhodopirellula sp. JC639]
MKRPLPLLFALPLFLLAIPQHLHAETWTDNTGQFQIDAEYVGVEGRSVVLRLADGSTKKVPIDRLSDASRNRAKELYEAAKQNPAAAKPAMNATPSATPRSSSAAKQHDFAPAVPSVPPMPAFPENGSLQQTVDFVVQQVLAGHPEVIWYALPADVRREVDSAEVRTAMRPSIEMQVQAQKPIEDVANKVCEILIRKKPFILNTPMLKMAPPQVMQMVQPLYDPATGLIYELVQCAFHSQMAVDQSVTAYVDHYGPRIGGHLHALVQSAPPGMIEQFTSKIVVDQIDDSSGTITVPKQDGGTTVVELVAYNGRWVPKEFVAKWKEKGGTMAEGLAEEFENNQEALQASQQQMAQATGMISAMANQFLQPMLDATNQQEFDAALTQAVMTATMMQNQAAPGLGPAPGARNPAFGQ